ncbi:TIM-barrel domain-containing protein [Paractinoplanes lichenicola]|uniref:Carbohydrate-binding protein n=1 Tax=Paractinoplanes lichenicola TaxID=2802976 RepID=A0ABS1VFI3_9ACTN|nr:TIM-barrel domain-containing protein [Actinoplanes lichenicola]MBL7253462.1 carbohydrate-binding protein [Actinoplanes lichenicola]
MTSRRDFLRTAGLAAGGAAIGKPSLARAAAVETLADYASHTADARTVTVTSTSGQRLRITAYGGHIVRVRYARAGETFFADSRYEMVDPASHGGMGGSLTVADGADALTITTGPADGIKVVLSKSPLRVAFHRKADDVLLAGEDATHSMTWDGDNYSVVRQTFVAPAAGERFVKAGHGFMGRAPRVDRTGEIVAHNYGRASNRSEQSPAIVQLYLSSRGYAVFVNTTFDTTFNFGSGGVYEFSADEHNTPGVRPQMDYFVIQGPRFAQLLDRYTQLTGRPRLPPLGIFGLQMSDKNFPGVSDQTWWVNKITEHRGQGFPLDLQVHDNRWRAGSGGWSGSWFEFDAGRWPDPAGFKRWADEQGISTSLDYNRNNSNLMAGWVPGPPPGYSFQPADISGVTENYSVPDWSNPATRAWVWNVFWTKALDPALGFPGDALWLDEPDELGPIPYGAIAANGQRWSELRNAYFLYLAKAVGQEGWDRHIGPTRRPFIFSRGATAGQQRYGHLWTGDTQSTYGEMQQQIRGMLNAGLGGFPFANVDGGGHNGNPIPPDMYRNWVAAWGALSPIWRPHGYGDTATLGQRASRWPTDQPAAESNDFLRYGRLRYTLLPYVYTIAHAARATGMPMARAMVVDHQDNPMAYSHDQQYMWGPSILVMPVTTGTAGAVQPVWLPAGETWYNFWSEAKSVGSDTSEKQFVTRTGEIILYVKAGAILPRYRYAQSTRFLDKTHLELDVYTGRDGVFDLLEDDGVSESPQAAVTAVTFTHAALTVAVRHPAGTYAGAPAVRRYVVRYHGLSAPVGLRVDGGPALAAFTSETAAVLAGSGQTWDANRKILSVVTPPVPVVTGGGVAATVRPSGEPFPAVTGPVVHAAEDAALTGVALGTQHPGYTGNGYADFTNATGDSVEWTVTTPTAGTYALGFRYTNGTGADRPLAVAVNGTTVAAALRFPATGGWSVWRTATLSASLPAGTVRIRATATGASGGNLDCLTVTPA